MIRDYEHAAQLQAAWEGPCIDTTPACETERLFALKFVIEACGFDIPDPLFDELALSIDEDADNAASGHRNADRDALREAIECQLRDGATMEWALRQIPAAAAHWQAQREAAARTAAHHAAKRAAIAFIASLQVTA